jgi:Protein kinase domain
MAATVSAMNAVDQLDGCCAMMGTMIGDAAALSTTNSVIAKQLPADSTAAATLAHHVDSDFDVFKAQAESVVDNDDPVVPTASSKAEPVVATDQSNTGNGVPEVLDYIPLASDSGLPLTDISAVGEVPGIGRQRPEPPLSNYQPLRRFVSPKDFDLLKVVGMGAFGKVLQVRNKRSQQVLAMKIISKRLLRRKGDSVIENVLAERNILKRLGRHPFVVAMHCSFQTKEKLFIIMDFLAGGELFLRLGREGIFLEKTVRSIEWHSGRLCAKIVCMFHRFSHDSTLHCTYIRRYFT